MEQGIQSLWFKLKALQDSALPELNGLFPSTRFHPSGYKRKDNSAYFSATLLHSLMRLESYLDQNEKVVLELIRSKTCEGVAPFQNKQGLPRYNFWQTNPGKHFPNGKLLGRWDYFRPPDDADDSVMIYMMQNRSREDALWLSQHIDSYANGSKKWIRNTPDEYKNLQAYCTFFNKDMPLGFDACVISNILYFNCLYGFEKSVAFEDSVRYLTKMLSSDDHINRPEKLAPYYPHSSIILYHMAKLMSRFEIVELNAFKSKIQDDLLDLLQNPLKPAERIMVESAWMWLSGSLAERTGNQSVLKKPFYFFVLPLTLEYEGILPQFLAHNRLSHLRFHCEALEIAFEIENRILRRSLF